MLELEGRYRVEAAVLVLELEGRCYHDGLGVGARMMKEYYFYWKISTLTKSQCSRCYC